MNNSLIEAGRIVNTHGIHGEVKIEPWCDSPDQLLDLKTIFINNNAVEILSARKHKNMVLAVLSGINSIDAAEKLKGEIIYINRSDITLYNDQFFINDLIGISVINHETSETLGVLRDVLSLPSNDVYVIRGDKEYMLPAVKEFIIDIDMQERIMRVKLIPGMCVTDENNKGADSP